MSHDEAPREAALTDQNFTRRSFVAGATVAGAAAAGAALAGCKSAGAPARHDHDDLKGADAKIKFYGPPNPHADRPTCVAVMSASRAVATDDHGRARVWDIAVDPARESPPHFRGHGRTKKVAYVTASTKADKVFSASYDGVVHVSELSTPARKFLFAFNRHTSNHEVWCVAVSDDGTVAASSTNGGEIRLWRTRDGAAIGGPFGYTRDPVGGLAFLPGTNDELLAGHGHGAAVWWKTKNADPVHHVFSHDNNLPVNAVAVSPKGGVAASAGFDMTVRVWDLKALAEIKVFENHNNYVWRVAFSDDGALLASAGEDGKVFVWRTSDWALHAELKPAEAGGVMGVAFSPEGDVVYTAGTNTPAVKRWKLPSAR